MSGGRIRLVCRTYLFIQDQPCFPTDHISREDFRSSKGLWIMNWKLGNNTARIHKVEGFRLWALSRIYHTCLSLFGVHSGPAEEPGVSREFVQAKIKIKITLSFNVTLVQQTINCLYGILYKSKANAHTLTRPEAHIGKHSISFFNFISLLVFRYRVTFLFTLLLEKKYPAKIVTMTC